jgi:hypothetical protein
LGLINKFSIFCATSSAMTSARALREYTRLRIDTVNGGETPEEADRMYARTARSSTICGRGAASGK